VGASSQSSHAPSWGSLLWWPGVKVLLGGGVASFFIVLRQFLALQSLTGVQGLGVSLILAQLATVAVGSTRPVLQSLGEGGISLGASPQPPQPLQPSRGASLGAGVDAGHSGKDSPRSEAGIDPDAPSLIGARLVQAGEHWGVVARVV
jgi:hypothetical protein